MTTHQAASELSHSRTEIIPRNPDFGDFKDLNKYWTTGNPGVSFALSFFSMVIPEGEKFFIRSVHAFKDQIDDPKLQEDIKGFTKQEAIHTQQHIVFNEALKSHGYDVDAVTESTIRFFKFIEKYFSKKTALAITVFAEHLTALGGEVELRFPELAEGTHPQAAKFWRWHAAEELEHKSVAFDVLSAVGGGYFHRMFAIAVLFSFFPIFMFGLIRKQVKNFDASPSDEVPVSLKEFVSKNPEVYPKLIKFGRRYFFSYFKPSFHPWQIDSRHYLDEWRNEIDALVLSSKA